MVDDLNELRMTLITELQEAREFAKQVSPKPTAQAYANAKVEILERLVILLHKAKQEGTLDMEKLKTEIKAGDKIALNELMVVKRGGKVEPKIKELATTLKPGEALPIDSSTISWAHFSGRVYSMRQKGMLSKDYAPLKRQDKFFLVRYTEEHMTAAEKDKK